MRVRREENTRTRRGDKKQQEYWKRYEKVSTGVWAEKQRTDGCDFETASIGKRPKGPRGGRAAGAAPWKSP